MKVCRFVEIEYIVSQKEYKSWKVKKTRVKQSALQKDTKLFLLNEDKKINGKFKYSTTKRLKITHVYTEIPIWAWGEALNKYIELTKQIELENLRDKN